MVDRPVTNEPTLLERIAAYLEKHDLAPTRFGKLAVGSPSLINRMKEGKSLRRGSIERIEALMAGPPVLLTPRIYNFRRYRAACSEQIRLDLAQRNHRLNDPVEQAMTVIRSRGWQVCRAATITEGAEGYVVGTLRLSETEMLERARKYGWRG